MRHITKTTKLIVGTRKNLKRTERTSTFLIFDVIILYFASKPLDVYVYDHPLKKVLAVSELCVQQG